MTTITLLNYQNVKALVKVDLLTTKEIKVITSYGDELLRIKHLDGEYTYIDPFRSTRSDTVFDDSAVLYTLGNGWNRRVMDWVNRGDSDEGCAILNGLELDY